MAGVSGAAESVANDIIAQTEYGPLDFDTQLNQQVQAAIPTPVVKLAAAPEASAPAGLNSPLLDLAQLPTVTVYQDPQKAQQQAQDALRNAGAALINSGEAIDPSQYNMDYHQIKQTALGNCQALSTLAAIVEQRPEELRNRIRVENNKDGIKENDVWYVKMPPSKFTNFQEKEIKVTRDKFNEFSYMNSSPKRPKW
jgi:hypothetical protein